MCDIFPAICGSAMVKRNNSDKMTGKNTIWFDNTHDLIREARQMVG